MTFIMEVFLSGCISKVINDVKDYSWTKIKGVINNKNDHSLSTKIYRIIENALNRVTDKKFKDTDKIYGAIERIFVAFRDNGNTIESVRCGLDSLNSNISVERCDDFIEKFYEEICQDEEVYKTISLVLQKRGLEINQKEFRQLNKTIEYGFDQLNKKIDDLVDSSIENSSNSEENETAKSLKFQYDKKQDYIKNWNSRLFLHIDKEKKSLTLKDAFIMPDCGYRITLGKIKYSLKDTLGDFVYKFVKYETTSNMLITGVPGIGKSTITSWIANQYRDDENCIILRFRDWESSELKKGLLKSICNTLECKKRDLENKILVIDGFDEMKALDIREKILNAFLNDIKDFENFKCIITSRPAYINSDYFMNRIDILPFDISRIKRFYRIITDNELNKAANVENLDVLGVPVILYMAIMSNIDITKNTSKPELYNCIFAEKGGIFDRFCEYDNGSQILRNPENIKKYLYFLKEVAFKMFEERDLQICKDECKIPKLEYQGKQVSILEFPIKHLFENTNPNIEFIHNSIYEYFVSEYIIVLIDGNISKGDEKLACIFGKVLKRNRLTKEIIEFLKYRIRNGESNNAFESINKAFQLMLRDGMTYHANEHNKNVHICEKNVFINMLEILHLWEFDSWKVNDTVNDYLKYNVSNLNLERADLRDVDLAGVYLYYANLKRANLSGGNFSDFDIKLEEKNDDSGLKRKDLRGANLRGADLSEADLRGREIEDAIFKDAILSQTIFDEYQIEILDGKCDLTKTRVYIQESREIISFFEYKKRKGRGDKDKEKKSNIFVTI